MFKFIVVFALLSGSALAAEDYWQPCRGGQPAPRSVVSPDCVGEQCVVTRGQFMNGNVFFTPTASHGNLIATIDAYLFGIWYEMAITPPDDEVINFN